MGRNRRLGVAVAVAAALATGALVVDRVNTADRLADRQVREARSLLAEAGVAAPDPMRAAVEEQLLGLINADRAAAGVPVVRRDGCMDAAASSRARQLGTGGAQRGPDAEGAVRSCRGPDAAWGDHIGDRHACFAPDLQGWWMSSAAHRPHVVDARFVVVGVGVWAEPAGRCWFQVLFGS